MAVRVRVQRRRGGVGAGGAACGAGFEAREIPLQLGLVDEVGFYLLDCGRVRFCGNIPVLAGVDLPFLRYVPSGRFAGPTLKPERTGGMVEEFDNVFLDPI
jgi:hypothetical protein